MTARSPWGRGRTPPTCKARQCECGDRLAFALRWRATPGFAVVATHGAGAARLEVLGDSLEGLLWALGAADPVGDWLQQIHECDGRVAG